jgi:hypothetical protein
MIIFKTGAAEWQNRHETFVEPIADLYELGNETALAAMEAYNDATQGILKLVQEAADKQTTLRALGAGWSWTKIMMPESNGILLDTKPLNSVFNISANSVVAGYAGDRKKLLFAQCGNGVWELSRYLKTKNLSLPTSGASNGQTVAGVTATGAHGSAFDVGAIQDCVVGIHIITGPGKHIYLERASYPVVSAGFVAGIHAELVQDDALFNAALVSFGSFGIIHGMMIEAVDLFLLESYMERMPYDDGLKHIMETLDFSNANLPCGNERPFHFAVSINPYDLAGGAYVTTMYKRDYRDDYVKPSDNATGVGPGDDAAVFVGHLTDVIPAIVPTLVNKLLAGAMTPYHQQFGILSEIFDNTTLHGKLLSAAIGIRIEDVTKVTELMLQLNKDKGSFTGLFAYRFIKKSKATLAFTRFDYTCVFELDAAFSDRTLAFYHEAWKLLEDNNIPFTFHWGKMNEIDPARMQRMYGDAAVAWVNARNTLLTPEARKIFANPLLNNWGLNG